MSLIETAFARYTLPSDDLAALATGVVASAEDPEYLATNLIAPTNTGHLNLPSRPAKLTTYSGYWDVTLPSAMAIQAAVLVYPNLDPGLDVSLNPTGGTPVPITIPSRWENGWWPNPVVQFTPQTAAVWRLAINGSNSLLPQVGRLLLFGSGGFRDLTNDLRWGVVEDEEQGEVADETGAQVETIYEMFGPRRSITGEFYLKNDTADSLVTLYRSARNRILPWVLWPDINNGDPMFVRFTINKWARTLDMIQNNIFPFSAKELSRGLNWP